MKDIKSEDVYIINKWKFNFYHCIILDELFQKINIKVKKKGKEGKKILLIIHQILLFNISDSLSDSFNKKNH